MSLRKTSFCIATIFAIFLLGWKVAKSNANESAKYTVIESDGPFEVREYPDLVIAATKMKVESNRDSGSFRRLFGYISGANNENQKIAMTTPVFMESELGQEEAQMGFVLPAEVAEARIPDPANEQVQIIKRASGRFAVIRFNGRMNSKAISKAEKSLRDWMKSKDFLGEEGMESAAYDPPWTPGSKRRNEILIRLKSAAEKPNAIKATAEQTRLPSGAPKE